MFGFGPRYARSDAITLQKDSVLKKVDLRFLELEVRVTEAAYNLARTSGLFCAPRVVGYKPKIGIIEFERISGYITIGQLLSQDADNLSVVYRTGRVLACIHQHLKLPPDLCYPITTRWMSSNNDVVPMHGDFNTINVGYKKDTDMIVVLDWASARGLGPRCTIGSRYVEIAHFICSIAVEQANIPDAIKRLRGRTNSFLQGYQDEWGQKIDFSILANLLTGICHIFLPYRIKNRGLLKRLYYTLVSSVGYMALRSLAREWHQLMPQQKSIFYDEARNV